MCEVFIEAYLRLKKYIINKKFNRFTSNVRIELQGTTNVMIVLHRHLRKLLTTHNVGENGRVCTRFSNYNCSVGAMKLANMMYL